MSGMWISALGQNSRQVAGNHVLIGANAVVLAGADNLHGGVSPPWLTDNVRKTESMRIYFINQYPRSAMAHPPSRGAGRLGCRAAHCLAWLGCRVGGLPN
jgi:hypothetical protein